MLLDKIYYTVDRLDGDYAYLKKEDDMSKGNDMSEENDASEVNDMSKENDTSEENDASEETKCVARALLPAEIMEGSRLLYEMMEYNLI